jgi:hypothetical protein
VHFLQQVHVISQIVMLQLCYILSSNCLHTMFAICFIFISVPISELYIFLLTGAKAIYVATVLISGVVIRVIQCCNLLHICLTFNIRAFFKYWCNLFSHLFFLSTCCNCVSVWSSNLGLYISHFYMQVINMYKPQ